VGHPRRQQRERPPLPNRTSQPEAQPARPVRPPALRRRPRAGSRTSRPPARR
jgi:hypothetical protein